MRLRFLPVLVAWALLCGAPLSSRAGSIAEPVGVGGDSIASAPGFNPAVSAGQNVAPVGGAPSLGGERFTFKARRRIGFVPDGQEPEVIAETPRKPVEAPGAFVVKGFQPDQAPARESDGDQMVAEVSHELRSPLTSIKMALSLLQDGASARDASLLATANSQVDRMSKMIEEVLDLSKGRATGWPIHPEASDPGALLRGAANGIEPWARAKGVALDVEAAALPEVNADRPRIQQVLTNLISNALKFSPKGSRITLRASLDEAPGFIRFSVTDQGPGMSAEELSKLFGRFVQFRNGEKVGGTGLGLTISKGLVERHGGRIWAESEPGKGTTFHFSLPAAGPKKA